MADISKRIISRFLRQSGLYAPTAKRVKYRAFLTGENKVSVFNITNLGEHEIWAISDRQTSGQPMRARGDLQVDHVEAIESVTIEWDDTPPLHANIVLPDDESTWMLKAQELASKAVLVLREP